MANEIIRPSKLPPRSNPVASEVVPSDDGSVVAGVSWKDGVNAGRPMASRLEAEAGVVADKAMSPLTTKQAIDAAASASANSSYVLDTVADAMGANIPPIINAIRVNGYYAAGDGGADLLREVVSPPIIKSWFVQDGGGRYWETADDLPNLKYFGAVGDGTSLDTAAINKAGEFAAEYNYSIDLGAGSYRVDDTLVFPPVLLHGRGIGVTNIIADGMAGADLFSFSEPVVKGCMGGLSHVQLIAKGANIKAGVRTPLLTPEQVNETFIRYDFHHIYCRGDERVLDKYSQGFDYSAEWWFDFGDNNSASYNDLYVHGSYNIKEEPDGQFVDGGIRLRAQHTQFTPRLFNIEVGPIHTAVQTDFSTFFSLDHFDLIGTMYGIRSDGVMSQGEPMITNGNINAQITGIELLDAVSRYITNVTIRRHQQGWKAATWDWHGIYGNHLRGSFIRGNTVMVNDTLGTFGGDNIGLYLGADGAGGGGGSTIVTDNIFGLGLDTAVVLDNVSGVQLKHNFMTSVLGSASTYLDLRNNARAVYADKPNPGSLSNPAYTRLKQDGTINFESNWLDELMDVQTIKTDAPVITIASDTITVTESFHRIDTEGSAGTDELHTITASPWMKVGTRLELRTTSSSRDVTLKDATGNLQLAGDFVLSAANDRIILEYLGSALGWAELARSDNNV